jgi:hypothetical protein
MGVGVARMEVERGGGKMSGLSRSDCSKGFVSRLGFGQSCLQIVSPLLF